MSNVAQIPTSFGHELRACLRCRLVKLTTRESGCENCQIFNMDKDHEMVGECTTSNFTGIISVMDPTRSWAARTLREHRKLAEEIVKRNKKRRLKIRGCWCLVSKLFQGGSSLPKVRTTRDIVQSVHMSFTWRDHHGPPTQARTSSNTYL
ncbi:hypothetical protein C5167_000033 [Papaver somniferum]|nr:hypothetical protein C5167_000033 [Papaver somniferum]